MASALIHVVGSGGSRDATARAVVAEVRRRGGKAFAASYVPFAVDRRGSTAATVVQASAALLHYIAVRGLWRLRHRGRVLVVTGHWYDGLGGCARPGDVGGGAALHASRPLFPLVPRASVIVLVGDGLPARPAVDGDWRAWMWHQLAPWLGSRVVTGSSAAEVVDALSAPPAPAHAWASAPMRRALDARVTLGASGPAAAAVHRPVRGYAAARTVDRALLPRRLALPNVAPEDGLDELCRRLGVEAEGFASFRSAKPGRLVVAAAAGGRLRLVLKLGPADDTALRREVAVLSQGDAGVNGVRTPPLVWSGMWEGRFVVASEGVERARPPGSVRPDEVVDLCLRLAGVDGGTPVVHGDLAPWNLLATNDGGDDLVVVDWEHHRHEDDPLHDLAHFIVQRASRLRAATPAGAVAQLTAPGSAGWRYLVGRGDDPTTAPTHLARYLAGAFDRTLFHQEMLGVLGG